MIQIEWVSKKARDEFAEQPIHKELEDAVRPAFDSEPLAANYVEFEDTKALGAPITEFVTFALKEGESITELKSLVEKIHQELAGTPKFHGDSWGPIIGKPNVYHGILGWDTEQVSSSGHTCVDRQQFCRHTGMLSPTVLSRH